MMRYDTVGFLGWYTVALLFETHAQIASFDQLTKHTVKELNISKMKALYEHIDDVDLIVGILSEKPYKGSLVGETMACILSKQFYMVLKLIRPN